MNELRWILLLIGLGVIGVILAVHAVRTWPRESDRESPGHQQHSRATNEMDERMDGWRSALGPQANEPSLDTTADEPFDESVDERRGQPIATRQAWSQAGMRDRALPPGSLDDPLFERDDADNAAPDRMRRSSPPDRFARSDSDGNTSRRDPSAVAEDSGRRIVPETAGVRSRGAVSDDDLAPDSAPSYVLGLRVEADDVRRPLNDGMTNVPGTSRRRGDPGRLLQSFSGWAVDVTGWAWRRLKYQRSSEKRALKADYEDASSTHRVDDDGAHRDSMALGDAAATQSGLNHSVMDSTLSRNPSERLNARAFTPQSNWISIESARNGARHGSSAVSECGGISRDETEFDEFGVSAPRVIARFDDLPESLSGRRSKQAVAGSTSARETTRAAASAAEMILVLYVVAPRNRPFTGVAVQASLRRAGLHLGQFSIYHRFDQAGEPLVSVANMIQPGTLTDDELADFTTPGLAAFVQVHAVSDPFVAFHALLETVDALARDLDGRVLDAHRSTATNQTLGKMQEDMQHWLLSHRAAWLRSRER
ncbi:MAG: cell division protein ZipA C-terminal FtsZ-binding domain-containing protein [Thioalkalivibrionaceae bacterium]